MARRSQARVRSSWGVFGWPRPVKFDDWAFQEFAAAVREHDPLWWLQRDMPRLFARVVERERQAGPAGARFDPLRDELVVERDAVRHRDRQIQLDMKRFRALRQGGPVSAERRVEDQEQGRLAL